MKKTPPILSKYLAQLGRRGGKARVEQLSPEERKELARQAGLASGKARRARAAKKTV
jgi:hypothetical protein